MDYCLQNIPETTDLGAVCGNGFMEDGEECDCGLEQVNSATDLGSVDAFNSSCIRLTALVFIYFDSSSQLLMVSVLSNDLII